MKSFWHFPPKNLLFNTSKTTYFLPHSAWTMLMNILTWLGARHLARKTPALTIHNSNTSGIPRLIFQILHQRGITVNLEGHLLTMLAVTVTSSDVSIVADIRETQQYLTPYEKSHELRTAPGSHRQLTASLQQAYVYVSLERDRFIYFLPVSSPAPPLNSSAHALRIYTICCLDSQEWQNSMSRLWQRASPNAVPSPGSWGDQDSRSRSASSLSSFASTRCTWLQTKRCS